jgi:hypothetical protein
LIASSTCSALLAGIIHSDCSCCSSALGVVLTRFCGRAKRI